MSGERTAACEDACFEPVSYRGAVCAGDVSHGNVSIGNAKRGTNAFANAVGCTGAPASDNASAAAPTRSPSRNDTAATISNAASGTATIEKRVAPMARTHRSNNIPT